MGETALIIEVAEAEPAVNGWRAHHDPVASLGVPAHITVLFPFVQPGVFDADIFNTLAEITRESRAFSYELNEVDEFPGAIWLRPEPDQQFRDLTRRLWKAFPDYPPYGGAFPDSQPHLTVALDHDEDSQARLAARIRDDLFPALPILCTTTALSVFMSDYQGSWHREHLLTLGH